MYMTVEVVPPMFTGFRTKFQNMDNKYGKAELFQTKMQGEMRGEKLFQ